MNKLSSSSFAIIFVFLNLLTLIETNGCASIYPNNDDLFIQSGKSLELSCEVNTCDPNINIYNWTIKFIQSETGSEEFFVNNSTNKIFSLDIPETSVENSGTYFCYLNGDLQDFKLVQIKNLPEPPQNIKCVLLNWITMTCYIEFYQKETDIPITWNMEYKYQSETNTLSCIRDDNDLYLNCGVVYIYKFSYYTMTAIGRNEKYDITFLNETSIRTDICCLVKPNPIDDLKITKTTNSSTVELSWKFPKGLPPVIDMIYKIDIQSEQDWDNRIIQIEDIVTNRHFRYVYKYTLTDLIPFVDYKIFISVKPIQAEGDFYWSESAMVTFKTDQDITGHATTFTKGSYYALNCGELYICPIIYWKNPEKKDSHSFLTGYEINISWINQLDVELNEENDVVYSAANLRHIKTNNLSGKKFYDISEVKLLKTQNYLVEMKIKTEIGFTKSISELLIPAWNKVKDFHPRRIIVEIDKQNNSAVVSWQRNSKLCEKRFEEFIYWCSTNPNAYEPYALCENQINWQMVSNKHNCEYAVERIELPYEIDVNNLKFGVSTEMNGINGGITWETCRFKEMFDPPDVPFYEINYVENKYDELKITMLYENCYSQKRGKPVKYEIAYEQFDNKQNDIKCKETNTISFPTNFDEPHLYLKGLKVRTEYIICLRAIGDYDIGTFGKPIIIRTNFESGKLLKYI